MNHSQALVDLTARLQEIADLRSADSLLYWDQATYMPPKAGQQRARQSSLLARLAHERATDPEVGRLLDSLRPYEESLPYESDDAALIRVTRREYERAVKVPSALMAELAEHFAGAWQAWSEARPANDFASARPYLEKTVDLSRRFAECFAPYDHIADPLIDQFDFGMKATTIRSLFAELRTALVPLVEAVTSQPLADDACLRQHYPEAEQWAFNMSILKEMGYDLDRGRLDKTHHPFEIRLSSGDVRLTTRVREDDLSYALFSTMHEGGHGLYEQGVAEELDATPLGQGTSSGVHESQSRTWENLVGRSRAFWEHFYPLAQKHFSSQLGGVPLETFYRAINKVQPSLIRTEADEVTYNLHVMLRFDFELDLLEGKLAIKDLPEAWRARYQKDLGIASKDDTDGALQDMHWWTTFVGGAFQGYTLGNIMSGIWWEAAVAAHPTIPAEIAQGRLDTLLAWQRENLHRHGSKFTAAELVRRVTGGDMTIEPYLRYLRTKFGELYRV